jgi:surface antigen
VKGELEMSMKTKLAVVSVALLVSSIAIPAYADCECVDYVRNRLQYTLGVKGAIAKTGNAYTWGNNLVALGLKWAGTPRQGAAQAGDVVVFQPSYKKISGNGVDARVGHIAFVNSAYYDSATKTWTLSYFGANQQFGEMRADAKCGNVSTVSTTYKDFAKESDRTVSYYRLR